MFWDQETWMLPPIQIFYPDVIRRILIESRIRNLSGAMDKARSLNYTGAMYPWESAYTGRYTLQNFKRKHISKLHKKVCDFVEWLGE